MIIESIPTIQLRIYITVETREFTELVEDAHVVVLSDKLTPLQAWSVAPENKAAA
jgi:hypothetical protein